MSKQGSGKPTMRRYSLEEKAAAARIVRTLRAELGTEYGTVHRVATQLGYGSSRFGCGSSRPTSTTGPFGVTSAEARRVRELEQQNREMRRANEIFKRAASFFGAELDRQHLK